MTVFQINVMDNVRSTGKIAAEIGQLVIDSGGESYIASSRLYIPSKSIHVKVGNYFDNALHLIEARLFDNMGFGLASRRATKSLVKKIKEVNPDIIHLHIIHGYYLNLPILFKYLQTCGIPVVWTIHSCWEFTGHCGWFATHQMSCNKWIEGCDRGGRCPMLKAYPKSILFDRTATNYRRKKLLFNSLPNLTLVTVSEWLGEIVGQSFLKNIPRTVISNGVDINAFRPMTKDEIEDSDLFRSIKNDIQGKSIILGVATTWTIDKGFEDYIKLSELIDDQTVIILVGVSNAQIKILPKNIIGIPRTNSREDLCRLYNLATVTTSLSYSETFGLTITESLSCGTPVVVYNNTVQIEHVKEGCVSAVASGDVAAAAEACKAFNDKSQFTAKCREHAVTHYDKSILYRQYIDLYSKIIKSNVNIQR